MNIIDKYKQFLSIHYTRSYKITKLFENEDIVVLMENIPFLGFIIMLFKNEEIALSCTIKSKIFEIADINGERYYSLDSPTGKDLYRRIKNKFEKYECILMMFLL